MAAALQGFDVSGTIARAETQSRGAQRPDPSARKRGRIIGALQLVMTESRRRYTDEDFSLAKAIAARVVSLARSAALIVTD